MSGSKQGTPPRSLDEWFWRVWECPDEDARQELLAQLRESAPGAARELDRMLRVAGEIGDFMSLRDEPHGLFAASAVQGDSHPAHESGALDKSPFGAQENSHGSVSAITDKGRQQLGPFRLLERIGEGGMGIVYLAQQTFPVQRLVAVKIIKPGMDSRQVIARFEAERQALAMMDHPNIAKVLDAGTTEAELPYFVMELVRGIPITEYCDRAKLKTRARLEIFLSACSALQHAHNKGIIHRDIKPSNVLVTEHDGAPVVKVIDFGVAKALTQNLTDKTLYTGMFQVIGTPLYMSPEQASLSNLDVDTRSDVYSLGILLYELLSGASPVDSDRIHEMSMEELRQHICDTDPPPPSKRLSTLREDRETIAERHGVDPKQLSRLVASELDWIVMRAIEKDRTRRYQSPREFSEDAQRFLAGEAVKACPPTWSYRMSKIMRRHRVVISTAALVFVALLCGIIVASLQAIRATQAERLAEANQRQAETNASRVAGLLYASDMATASKRFLVGDHASLQDILARYAPANAEAEDFRGFEWFFLRSLSPVMRRAIYRTDTRIDALAISEDESLVSVGDAEGTIAILASGSWQTLCSFPAEIGEVSDICFIAQDQLAACGTDGWVSVWAVEAVPGRARELLRREVSKDALLALSVDVDTGNLLTAGDDGIVYRVNLRSGTVSSLCVPLASRVESLEALPSRRVLAGLNDGSYAMLDYSDETLLPAMPVWRRTEAKRMFGFRDLCFQPAPRLLAAAQLGGLVTMLEVDEEPRVVFAHLFPADVHGIGLSADGRWLAAGDAAGTVHLISTASDEDDVFLNSEAARNRRMRSWQTHDAKIERVVFLPNVGGNAEQTILTAGRNGRVVVSRPLKQSAVTHYEQERIADFAFVDANRLLVAGNDISIHDIENPPDVADSLQLFGLWMRVDLNGRRQALFRKADTEVFLAEDVENGLDSESLELVWQADDELAQMSALSPDGKLFALDVKTISLEKHHLEVYRIGEQVPFIRLHTDKANDIQFSPDGRSLAYIRNNDIHILDLDSKEIVSTLSGHRDTIQDLEFSPHGDYLASVSSDRSLILWNLAKGEPAWTAIAHDHRAMCLAFHPSLPTLATAGEDAMVRFWRLDSASLSASARLVGEFPLDFGTPKKLAFSPDGTRLVVRHAWAKLSILTAADIPSRP